MRDKERTVIGAYAIGSDCWPGTSKLLEEMGELQQVIGKLIGASGQAEHWDKSNLRERIVEEAGDLLAAIQFFRQHNLTTEENEAIAQRCAQKHVLFEKWHQEQRTTERTMKNRYVAKYMGLTFWLVLVMVRHQGTRRWQWREVLHEEMPYWAIHYAVRYINDGRAVRVLCPGGIIAVESYPDSRRSKQ